MSSVAYATKRVFTNCQYDVHSPFWCARLAFDRQLWAFGTVSAGFLKNNWNNQIAAFFWSLWVVSVTWRIGKNWKCWLGFVFQSLWFQVYFKKPPHFCSSFCSVIILTMQTLKQTEGPELQDPWVGYLGRWDAGTGLLVSILAKICVRQQRVLFIPISCGSCRGLNYGGSHSYDGSFPSFHLQPTSCTVMSVMLPWYDQIRPLHLAFVQHRWTCSCEGHYSSWKNALVEHLRKYN